MAFVRAGQFPAQRASNAENVSIPWRHHDEFSILCKRVFYWYHISVLCYHSQILLAIMHLELLLANWRSTWISKSINTLGPTQNGRHFADDTFKRIFLNENVGILIENSLKFVHKGPINNIPALVQIMAWRRSGDKTLCEPMVVRLPTHICVTRPQWVVQHVCSTSTPDMILKLSDITTLDGRTGKTVFSQSCAVASVFTSYKRMCM